LKVTGDCQWQSRTLSRIWHPNNRSLHSVGQIEKQLFHLGPSILRSNVLHSGQSSCIYCMSPFVQDSYEFLSGFSFRRTCSKENEFYTMLKWSEPVLPYMEDQDASTLSFQLYLGLGLGGPCRVLGLSLHNRIQHHLPL
jgi:hypothetical protein